MIWTLMHFNNKSTLHSLMDHQQPFVLGISMSGIYVEYLVEKLN